MRRIAIVLAVLFLFTMTASAQNQIKPVVYLGGGVGLPLSPSDFSDYWKMGLGFGGGVGAQVTPNLEVVGKFFYNSFPINEDDFWELLDLVEEAEEFNLSIEGGAVKIMEFGADVKYLFTTGPDAKFGPFLVAGLGMANISISDVTVTDGVVSVTEELDEGETKFALAIGAGFDYMFSPKVGFWMEGRYVTVLTEDESSAYLPIRAGVKMFFGN